MKKFDLQVHTDASPCSTATPKEIVKAAVKSGLDGIAITNHDTLEGFEQVNRLAPKKLEVLPGVEVTTTQGHLLAVDVNTVPTSNDPMNVINEIHSQDGLAILSHPFDRLRQYYNRNLDHIAQTIDAIEVINSRCLFQRYNKQGKEFAVDNQLAQVGGSDAHFPMEFGRAYTLYDESIIDSIRANTTRACGRGGYLSGHIATKINDTKNFFK